MKRYWQAAVAVVLAVLSLRGIMDIWERASFTGKAALAGAGAVISVTAAAFALRALGLI